MGFEQEALKALIHATLSHRSQMEQWMAGSSKGERFALRQLNERGAMSPSQLADLMRVSSGRVSTVLGALEKKGFISRDVDPDDRRNVIVTITDSGRERAQRDHEAMKESVCWIFSQMGERRTREFVELTEEFLTYMALREPGGPEPTAEQIKEAFSRPE